MHGGAAWRGAAGALGCVRCGVDCVGSARQAFIGASAFNQNISSWNTASVTTFGGAFEGVGLAGCIKRSVYDNWGSTLRTAYPSWSSLSSLCPNPVITDANLGTAVTAWATNPSTAQTTFGPIADWNTAAVTSMANLLFPNRPWPAFNDDISKWNTASVSNMKQACALLL
jgi:surface protein